MVPDGIILWASWPDAFTKEEPLCTNFSGFQQLVGLSGEDKIV
jgi:hypothetical protein